MTLTAVFVTLAVFALSVLGYLFYLVKKNPLNPDSYKSANSEPLPIEEELPPVEATPELPLEIVTLKKKPKKRKKKKKTKK